MQIRDIEDPRLVKAIAHPLRIRILHVLESRTASPSEVADELAVKLTNISYHFRVLERAGLIELVKTRPRRGAIEHYYKSRGRLQITDAAWAQLPEIVRNAAADAALADAVASIATAASAGGFARKEAAGIRLELTLDEEGFRELSAQTTALYRRALEIEKASAKRLQAGNGHAPINAGCVLALFESVPVDSEVTRHRHRARNRATA